LRNDLNLLMDYEKKPKPVAKPNSPLADEQAKEANVIQIVKNRLPKLELMDEATGSNSPNIWNPESMKECRRVRDMIGEYNESLLQLLNSDGESTPKA
jgi:hypothetical protein